MKNNNIESPKEQAQRMRDESQRDEEMPEEIELDQPECYEWSK